MKTAELKTNLHQIIDGIEDNTILNAVYALLAKTFHPRALGAKADFWDELSEEEKADIEHGLKDIERGKVFSHEEVMREVKTKFNL